MKRRTPEEKKLLSYERDRRYAYGNSPHAARNSVPLNKARRNRANRHAANQQVDYQGPTPDEDFADNLESLANRRVPNNWTKYPDESLGKIVADNLQKRTPRKNNGRKTVLGKLYPKLEK